MGKGLSVSVIVELLFYVSAGLIPLALPLAILLSSIMTFGNLSEHNELTALKSSGLSLYRIIRPLTIVVFLIAIFTFYFANYVIPVATYKWHSLMFDIQQKKITTVLTPGAYNQELEGYAIKIDEGKDDTFKGILIHDHTTPTQLKTVRAKNGKIYKSENGKYLFFELKDGYVLEELSPKTPSYTPDGKQHGTPNMRESRKSRFQHATYKIDLSGFDLNRSREDLFKDKHEMLNVFQINDALDSIGNNAKKVMENFLLNIKNDHPYFSSLTYEENTVNLSRSDKMQLDSIAPDTVVVYNHLNTGDKIRAINLAQSKIRTKKQNLDSQKLYLDAVQQDVTDYLIGFHKKIALTVAIIILFFIGAPLGAIVRKGGFGAPVVIAALLFMIYFVLITIGDNLAKAGTVSPFMGMWFASIVLAPIAFWFMRSAATDSPVFSKDAWLKFFRLKR